MGTLEPRHLTTDSILRIDETEIEAVLCFTRRMAKTRNVVITYEEHPSLEQCFLHIKSSGMIPKDELDLLCRMSGVQMWTYYVLH